MLLRLLELEEDVRRLAQRGRSIEGPEVDLLEPVPFDSSYVVQTHPTSDLLGMLHLVPFRLTGRMHLRRFMAWVSCSSVTTCTFIAGIYRLINADAARKDGSRVNGGSDGSSAVGMSMLMEPRLRGELLEVFDPFRTDSTSVVPYRCDMKRGSVLLLPGNYALGYTVSSTVGRWHYGPPITVRSAYRSDHDTDARKVTARGVAVPAPFFVLRSDRGVRMHPYRDEVQSGW